ncbi:hypothetical protein ColTof3_14784 [Colletotrichum tofieldiae]|nr:hypothetical protein ColTof3_14784 [Colletotrichum tofieldiae]
MEEISDIQANSYRCKADQASEAIWNTEVHHQVLRVALRKDSGRMMSGLVNFFAWRQTNLDLGTLDFLPGLIVQGPEWFFVALTRKNGRTCLALWCAEEYWLWFRANALDLDD